MGGLPLGKVMVCQRAEKGQQKGCEESQGRDRKEDFGPEKGVAANGRYSGKEVGCMVYIRHGEKQARRPTRFFASLRMTRVGGTPSGTIIAYCLRMTKKKLPLPTHRTTGCGRPEQRASSPPAIRRLLCLFLYRCQVSFPTARIQIERRQAT